jgi:serine/threonine-protein kinase RsbT
MTEIETDGVTRVAIDSDRAIVEARQSGRRLAIGMGFSSGEATLVATAISELARNILQYAGKGEITMKPMEDNGAPGLAVLAIDDGPGIGDIAQALQDGYSTSGRLGLGLPGVRRLMDEFDLDSTLGSGTRVRVVKWKRA